MARSCRHCLGIHTPRVLGVGVGNVTVQQRVTFAMIGRWPSGNHIVVSVLTLNTVNHLGRHAGVLTGPTANPPLSPASKSGAASPAPLPHPDPSPSEGSGIGGEMLSDDLKRPRMSSSP